LSDMVETRLCAFTPLIPHQLYCAICKTAHCPDLSLILASTQVCPTKKRPVDGLDSQFCNEWLQLRRKLLCRRCKAACFIAIHPLESLHSICQYTFQIAVVVLPLKRKRRRPANVIQPRPTKARHRPG